MKNMRRVRHVSIIEENKLVLGIYTGYTQMNGAVSKVIKE
jgi:hypothetical protein